MTLVKFCPAAIYLVNLQRKVPSKKEPSTGNRKERQHMLII